MTRSIVSLDIPSPDHSPLSVTYERSYLGGDSKFRTDHIELRGKCISETGYRSEFIVGGTEDPERYATELVRYLFTERLKAGYQSGQVTLFA